MLPTNSGRFWVRGDVTADCAARPVAGCAEEVLPVVGSCFIVFLCSMMGRWVGFCMLSLEPLTCLNSKPFLKHLFSGLNVIQLQVRIQICDSLICIPCLVLWARSDLPVAIFCIENSMFFHMYSCVSESACVAHGQVIQNISPKSHDFQICCQLEKGTLKISCFPSSPLPSCCTKWGSASSSLIFSSSPLCPFPYTAPSLRPCLVSNS